MKIQNIGVGYDDTKSVLNDINLTIKGGEIIGIVGENGVGKTTFTKAIAGLLPYSGKISYNEKELSKFSEKDFEKFIGYFPRKSLSSQQA